MVRWMRNRNFGGVRQWIILSFAGFTILNGCATIKFAEYQPRPLDSYKHFQSNDDLAVAVHPLTNPKETQSHFGVDLLASGILPVFVIAENKSSSTKYILEKNRFALDLNVGQASTLEESNKRSATHGIGSVGLGVMGLMPILAPVALPLYFSGLSDLRDANDIKHNFISKELQRKILSPGERSSGFVYFEVQDRSQVQSKILKIVVVKVGTNDLTEFEFKID